MQCEELSDQMQNMGIYDRCEKDVKNCRPHSLKLEEGLLTIDKDFLSLFVCIHLKPKGTKVKHTFLFLLERFIYIYIERENFW